MQYKLLDIFTFSYLTVLSLLIFVFRYALKGWYLYLGFHVFYIFLVLTLIWADNKLHNRVTNLLHCGYPLLSFPMMYEELGHFIHLIFPNWFDCVIHHLELSLFHMHPTIWLQQIVSPWVTEYFKAAYCSYYFIVPIAALCLYVKGSMKIFEEFITTLAFVFYICYIGFILIPVEGPRYALAPFYTVPLRGYIITSLQDSLTNIGALHGGCMPSSHVGIALVSLIFVRRYVRSVYYFLLPVFISLVAATVYTRDHYLSDAIAGLLVGWLGLFLVPRLITVWNRQRINSGAGVIA